MIRFFAKTFFSPTQRSNVGTMLSLFKTMTQQYCNAVLHQKSLLRIVSCNITLMKISCTHDSIEQKKTPRSLIVYILTRVKYQADTSLMSQKSLIFLSITSVKPTLFPDIGEASF